MDLFRPDPIHEGFGYDVKQRASWKVFLILELGRPDRLNNKDRNLSSVVAGGFSDVSEQTQVVKTSPDLFLDEIHYGVHVYWVVAVKLSGQKTGSARKMGPLKFRSTRKLSPHSTFLDTSRKAPVPAIFSFPS